MVMAKIMANPNANPSPNPNSRRNLQWDRSTTVDPKTNKMDHNGDGLDYNAACPDRGIALSSWFIFEVFRCLTTSQR